MGSNLRALAYLQFRIARNWIRRSARSLVVWVLILGFAFLSVSGVLFGGGGEPRNGDGEPSVPSILFEASAVLLLISTLAFAVWRGTGPPPRATAADIIFVLGSPIRARVQFAFLMFREVATLLSILTIVALLSLIGSLARAFTDSDASIEGAFSTPTVGIWLIVLIGGITRLAVWVATEQVIVRDAKLGHRLRLAIRGAVVVIAAALLAFVFVPVVTQEHEDYRSMADQAAERVMQLAAFPPLSLPPMIYSDDGPTLLVLGGLLLFSAIIAGLGLVFARDFNEPIAIMAERLTDARGQSNDSGNDLQWSTLSQLGTAPRLRFSIKPFGRGPWALFWSSLVRWARYQMSVAWLSVLTLVGMAVIVTVLVQQDVISTFWIWGLALSMPIFSSYNMFLDELRKPYLFMTPGAPWKRLVAAGATSVIDGVIASAMLAVIAVLTRALPAGEAILLLVAAATLGLLIQASVGLVQVVLPSWLNRKVRTSLTFGANVVAMLPAATAFVAGLVASGALTGYTAAVVTALITAAVVLSLSVLLFDRLEMPG